MNTEEIRKLLEQGKLTIGLNESRKLLETKGATTLLVAENAPAMEADAMRDYAEMADVSVETLDMRNDQLGKICRKGFPIAFIAVNK